MPGKHGGGGAGGGSGAASASRSASDDYAFRRKSKHTIIRLQQLLQKARADGTATLAALDTIHTSIAAIITAIGTEVDNIRVELASYTGEDITAATAACDAIDASIDTDLTSDNADLQTEEDAMQVWLDSL